MIKDNSYYLYLIVPNEYRCVFYNILDTLGTLGEDLLSSCTATCKGKAINGIACYNMFNAACACYYLGEIKRARVLISYIKAQLNIECNNTIIFENSDEDEFLYLQVPVVYEYAFEELLTKMSSWGQDLLDDCTASCKGANKDIFNCWNLFRAACLAYQFGDTNKSDYLINYISRVINIPTPTPNPGPNPEPTPTPTPTPEPEPEPEPTPGYEAPVLRNLSLVTTYDVNEGALSIDSGSIDIINKQNIVPNSMKLINASSGITIAQDLPVDEEIELSVEDLEVGYSTDVNFVAEVTGTDGKRYKSPIYTVTTEPEPEPDYDLPAIMGLRVVFNSTYENPTINIAGCVATFINKENLAENTLVLKDITNNRVVKSGMAIPRRETVSVGVENYAVSYNSTIKFVLEATDIKGNLIKSNETSIDIPSQYVAPVINISNIGYEVVDGRVHITSVQGTITNPQNFDDYGVDVNVSPYGEYDNSYYSAAKQLTPSPSFNYPLDIWFDLRTDVDNSNMIDPNNDGTPHTNEFRVLIDGIGKNRHPVLGHRAIYVCWDDI